MRGKLAGLLTALLLLGPIASAQVSLTWDVVGSAGQPGTSAGFTLNGTAGQAIQGTGASASFLVGCGFWFGPGRISLVPLPRSWMELAGLPAGGDPQDAVGAGSWLALQGKYVYAVKGRGNQGLYRFDRTAREWAPQPLALIPLAGNSKPIDDGCRGVVDEAGEYLYIVHGNATRAFWRYDIVADEWLALADVPPGPRNKGAEGGSDMVLVAGSIYLLKGGFSEFYRYGINTGEWQALADAPGQPARWMSGSWLAWDRGSGIYAHRAQFVSDTLKVNHCLYRYDIATATWSTELPGMPVVPPGETQRTLSRDGGSGVYHDGRLFALKGGNTAEFFEYEIGAQAWRRIEDIGLSAQGPERRVYAGGYLVSDQSGEMYALKGNQTNEFWRYGSGLALIAGQPERSGVMAGEPTVGQPFVRLGPNPLLGGRALVRYGYLRPGLVRLTAYDISGRRALHREFVATRSGTLSLDLSDLSAGVYLVKVQAEDFAATQKLVVQR